MKLFVWDFHGTLEYGNDYAVTDITNLAMRQRGHDRVMTHQESLMLSGKRWHEYFSYLLPDVDQKEHETLQLLCFEISQNQPELIAKHIQLTQHADYVLQEITKSSHQQILVSHTQQDALHWYVEQLDLSKYFHSSNIYGVDTHTCKNRSKQQVVQTILDHDKFEEIISIGDSPLDASLANLHPKGKSYLYAHPGKKHRDATAHHKISDLRDVLNCICNTSPAANDFEAIQIATNSGEKRIVSFRR